MRMPSTVPFDSAPNKVSDMQIMRAETQPLAGTLAPATMLSPSEERDVISLQGAGVPLENSSRIFFENRMGRNFADVRVHTDARANATARSLRARAFTVGNDIAFAQGEYQPATMAGNRLLAHELTHVVQQSRGSTQQIQRSESDLNTSRDELLAALREAIRNEKWQEVATRLNGFNDDDIKRLAGGLTDREAANTQEAVELYLSGWPRESYIIASLTANRAIVAPSRNISLAVIVNGVSYIKTIALHLYRGDSSDENDEWSITLKLAREGYDIYKTIKLVQEVAEEISEEAAIEVAEETTIVNVGGTAVTESAAITEVSIVSVSGQAVAVDVALPLAASGSVFLIGVAIGAGIALSPFAIAHAQWVHDTLGEYGGTLPDGGGLPNPSESEDSECESCRISRIGTTILNNYGYLDDLGRPTGVTARIKRRPDPGSAPKCDPVGWPKKNPKENNRYLFSRAHLIADTLGGEGEYKNLVTFRHEINQEMFTKMESKVRNYLNEIKHRDSCVIIESTPLWAGRNLVPYKIELHAYDECTQKEIVRDSVTNTQ